MSNKHLFQVKSLGMLDVSENRGTAYCPLSGWGKGAVTLLPFPPVSLTALAFRSAQFPLSGVAITVRGMINAFL